jgi:hypothetical protein
VYSRGIFKLTTHPDQWRHQLCDKMSVLCQHHLCYLRNDKTSSIHLDIFPLHCPWTCKKNLLQCVVKDWQKNLRMYLILITKKVYDLTFRGFRFSGGWCRVIGRVVLDVSKEHNAFTFKCQAAQEETWTAWPLNIRILSSIETPSYPRRPESSEKHLWET